MNHHCHIPYTLERIKMAGGAPIAFIGGSMTIASGASDTTATSWRRLFMRFIYEHYVSVYHCKAAEIMGAIGAIKSVGSSFMLKRNILPRKPVLAFIEECVNDRQSPDKDLVRKGIEGIIRQLKAADPATDIVFLGAGCRPGKGDREDGLIDHTLHRELADYYGCAFIDIQEYLLKELKKRGQSWDNIAVTAWPDDPLHINDYGNHLWFSCVKDWFLEQEVAYAQDPQFKPGRLLAKPLHSDELQFTKLIDPSRKSKHIVLEGSWKKSEDISVPWYMDNVFEGRPGDTLRFTFTGTAVGTFSHVYNNGLKLEAKIDGVDAVGPFTNFTVEFGNFDMIAHGLPLKEHILELTVAKPMKRLNNLEDPTARLGYIGIATGNPIPVKEGGEHESSQYAIRK